MNARLLAMQTAREAPGATLRAVPMAFDVVDPGEDEDYYNITLSFRPEGAYTGKSGREQFFIEKEGGVAHGRCWTYPWKLGADPPRPFYYL